MFNELSFIETRLRKNNFRFLLRLNCKCFKVRFRLRILKWCTWQLKVTPQMWRCMLRVSMLTVIKMQYQELFWRTQSRIVKMALLSSICLLKLKSLEFRYPQDAQFFSTPSPPKSSNFTCWHISYASLILTSLPLWECQVQFYTLKNSRNRSLKEAKNTIMKLLLDCSH